VEIKQTLIKQKTLLIVTAKDEDALELLRHDCAHVICNTLHLFSVGIHVVDGNDVPQLTCTIRFVIGTPSACVPSQPRPAARVA